MTKILSPILLSCFFLSAALFSSCSSGSDSNMAIIDPAGFNIPYGSDQVWTEKFSNMPLTLSPFTFSHWSNGEQWTGFVPSRVTDNTMTSDWTARQWASATGGGVGGRGMSYFVVGYDKSEPLDAIPASPSAMMRMSQSGSTFSPQMIWITNTAQAFHTMYSGQPDTPPFLNSDWAKILIIGVKDGHKTGSVTVWTARDGQFLGDPDNLFNSLTNGGGWMAADVKALGEVDYVYFQMQASRDDYTPTFVVGAYTYE
ncbi:MAG: DUF4465 domain-containing protein [Pseudoflavonifractor sp.]|nr:DUF4465 domain-containing protein [Alloprevotella sp.]MCM1117484.1 DUF4465 domain-containing protein [Pseudoflavonifractor sp.]